MMKGVSAQLARQSPLLSETQPTQAEVSAAPMEVSTAGLNHAMIIDTPTVETNVPLVQSESRHSLREQPPSTQIDPSIVAIVQGPPEDRGVEQYTQPAMRQCAEPSYNSGVEGVATYPKRQKLHTPWISPPSIPLPPVGQLVGAEWHHCRSSA